MAETATRIYVVTEVGGDGKPREFLVLATSQAQAIRHVVKGRFTAELCSAAEAIRLATAGVTVSEAGAE